MTNGTPYILKMDRLRSYSSLKEYTIQQVNYKCDVVKFQL